MKRSTRREIARDTLQILEQGYYTNSKGKKVDITAIQQYAEEGTILYTPEALNTLVNKLLLEDTDYTTTFEVNDLTTLDAVRKVFKDDGNIICLNFASARNPGGGFLNGSQAQEESIARATGLYPCQLKAEAYYTKNRAFTSCLYTEHMIYTPSVPILKDEKGVLLENFSYCSVLTAPAVNSGAVQRNEPQNVHKIEPYMKRRIDRVLAICKYHEYDTLVLGAWGCGVFRNDPNTIAQIFYEYLTGKYKNQFKKIIFAIYSKDEKFITPFIELFN